MVKDRIPHNKMSVFTTLCISAEEARQGFVEETLGGGGAWGTE